MTATNRIAKNSTKRKRIPKRFWFGMLCAILLVTWPVLPPNPLSVFDPENLNWDNIKGMIVSFCRKPFTHGQAGDREGKATAMRQSAASVPPEDIRALSAAIDQLNQQIGRFPDDPSLHNRIGILYAQLGEFTLAIEHFNRTVDLCHERITSISRANKEAKKGGLSDESSALAGAQLNVDLSAAHSNLARIYEKLGRHNQVVSQLDQLSRDITFAGEFSASIAGRGSNSLLNKEPRLTPTAAAGLARAQALLQARREPEAIQEYQKLISTEPKMAVAHEQLGLIFARHNDLASAISEFEVAAQLDPQDAETRNNLGLAYLSRGDRDLANAEFARACSLDPKNIDAAINLANLLSASGQYEQAIQTLQTSLAYNPRSAAGHNNLASLLSTTGRLRESIAEFHAALTLRPDMATAHYGLGLALLKAQSYPSSIREFKQALALNPALIDAHNKLEQAYRKNEMAVTSAPGID